MFDDQVAILGNGNQDTQSWFHSQEINVMVDSPQLCHEWLEAINRNQNTLVNGKVDDKDGLYRDKEGNVIQSAGGTDSECTVHCEGRRLIICTSWPKGRVQGYQGHDRPRPRCGRHWWSVSDKKVACVQRDCG